MSFMEQVGPWSADPGGPTFVPVVVDGGFAFVSGQLPYSDGELKYQGKVGAGICLDDARAAARLCALRCLSVLGRELGGLDRIRRIVKLTGYVASTSGFRQQTLVVGAASEALVDALGDVGHHAGSAIGVAELPNGACVEIEVVASVAGAA